MISVNNSAQQSGRDVLHTFVLPIWADMRCSASASAAGSSSWRADSGCACVVALQDAQRKAASLRQYTVAGVTSQSSHRRARTCRLAMGLP